MEKRYNTRARLGGFAVSHFLISIVGFASVILFFALELNYDLGFWLLVISSVVLLAAYLPAGAWTARRKQWSRPQTFGEGLRYFLAPAAIAWGWGTLVAVTTLLDAISVLVVEFLVTSLLASPAVLMFYVSVILQDLGMEGWLWLWVYVLLAGGLPPLLFTLGSVLGSGKLGVRNEECGEIRDKRYAVAVILRRGAIYGGREGARS